MIRTPLQLSEPLYNWDSGAENEHVSFDELHQRVIHRRKGSFFAVNIVEEGDPPDGLFVKFDHEGLRLVRFAPDGQHFVYLCNRNNVGCVATSDPTQDPINVSLKCGGSSSGRDNAEVLNLFWLPGLSRQAEQTADLVIVSTLGVELFRVHFKERNAKSLKAFPVSVRLCWAEPASGMVLICTSTRTLQPFDLRNKVPQKMQKFDIILGKNKSIDVHDCAVMTIYDSTYCIHADSTNGRVSLRNISNPLQGTPEHDIVIDVAEDEAAPSLGAFRLSKVDNFLIVHCIDRMMSIIFDTRHREKTSVPSICGPTSLALSSKGPERCEWKNWEYASGSTIIDQSNGMVFRLKINVDAVLREFSVLTPRDLATVMRLLLRRTSCREQIVNLLKQALESKTSFNELIHGFNVVNHAYRVAIEALSSRTSSGQSGHNTVSLQELELLIGQQSILSEKDMVSQVFYPHFMASKPRDEASMLRPAVLSPAADANSAAMLDAWRIPLAPTVDESVLDRSGNRPARSPYLVSVVVAYLRSLLSMQILPHKILQCFVFDLCMYSDQEHTLQQLLHYHVLLDSPELLLRLKEVAEVRPSSSWAAQACLDMALRLQDHCVVADILLFTRQYLDIVPFLMNQQVASFQLRKLFQQAESDAQARAEDPDLLTAIIRDIRLWRQEAAGGENMCISPNLEGCEQWLEK